MFRLFGTLASAAVLGGLGYLGYKRFYGSTDAMNCDGGYPWYLPAPLYGCGQNTSHGAINGMQYQSGEWVYRFADGTMAKESAMSASGTTSTSVQAQTPVAGIVAGAGVQIL